MHPLFYVMMALTIFCGMGALASVMLGRSSRAATERVYTITHGVREMHNTKARSNEVRTRLVDLLHWLRTTLGMANNDKLVERLAQAGFKGSAPLDLYQAARFVGPLLALALGSFLPGSRLLWMLGLPSILYLTPDIILQRLVKRRREKIRLSVPDAVDLLVICVDAGLGLDQAIDAYRAGTQCEPS